MRKNAPRKWLHAILDLLPVILIPVFMIYSHRHDIEGNQAQVSESLNVDFNQLVVNGDFDNLDTWYSYDASVTTLSVSNNICTVNIADNQYPAGYGYGLRCSIVPSIIGHKYFLCGDILSNTTNNILCFDDYGAGFDLSPSGVIWSCTSVRNYLMIRLRGVSNLPSNCSYSVSNIMSFDLTQMFGIGNEPTAQQFNSWFTDNYYDYTLSKSFWIEDYNVVTYSDADVMSQFSYQLYNATDKYFNMDKAFNLGAVHQWFNNNIFNGQPPLYMNVVWHIIAYELLMDLMFLLYALFMWFIDWCKSLIERTYDTSRGK